jgi:hypothetical protein
MNKITFISLTETYTHMQTQSYAYTYKHPKSLIHIIYQINYMPEVFIVSWIPPNLLMLGYTVYRFGH